MIQLHPVFNKILQDFKGEEFEEFDKVFEVKEIEAKHNELEKKIKEVGIKDE